MYLFRECMQQFIVIDGGPKQCKYLKYVNCRMVIVYCLVRTASLSAPRWAL